MSITRVTTFVAQDDGARADQLRGFLQSIVPTIRSSPGCQSCQLLQAKDRPARLIVIEVWDDIAAHEAAVREIPPESFAQVMPLLAGRPSGEYLLPV